MGRGGAGRADSDWEGVVKAAKAEGQLAIYANTSFEAIFPEFRKKYPEIKITYVTGVGAPDVVPRVLSEQRGGKFLGDLALLGGSGLYSLYQAKALDPLKPALMLPEVVDESKWWEGRHDYLDKERNYIFSFNGVSRVDVVYNKELVDPKELKSYWDLLNAPVCWATSVSVVSLNGPVWVVASHIPVASALVSC